MTLEAGVDERYIMRGRSSITGRLLTTSRIHPASKELSSYPVYLTSGTLPILALIFTCAVEVSRDSSPRVLTNTTAPAAVSLVSKQPAINMDRTSRPYEPPRRNMFRQIQHHFNKIQVLSGQWDDSGMRK